LATENAMLTEKLHLRCFRYHCCFKTTNYIVKKTTIQLSKNMQLDQHPIVCQR